MPGSDAWNFHGELVIFVEDGCVEVEMGGESYVVETGDSIHFDSSMSHSWVAGRGQPAKVTVIAIIPEHLHADARSRAAAVAVSGIESFEIEEVEACDEAIVADREAP